LNNKNKILNTILFVDEFVKQRWNCYSKQHYIDLGYTFTKLNDTFNVKIKDLMGQSVVKVRVECPKCHKQRVVQYRHIARKGNSLCYGCAKSIKYKSPPCCFCGKEDGVIRYYKNKPYCNKHYRQAKNDHLGHRNQFDQNEYYYLNNEVVEIFTYNINQEKTGSFLIDTEDLGKVIKYKWRGANKYTSYVTRMCKGKTIYLHKYLMGTKVGDIRDVDHINRIPRDNRKCNLRIVSHKENCNNRGDKIPWIDDLSILIK
jgi:hypothetical protein